MATTTAIITNDGLLLSPDFMAEHHLKPGAQVTITVEEPLHGNSNIDRLISETRGMFAGGPSMADELMRDRREDDQRFSER